MRRHGIRSMFNLFLVPLVVVLVTAGTAWGGFAGTDVFVASVGHGSGAGGSQWRTTLWIANPGTSAADCQVQFLPRGTSNPSPAGTYNVTVQGGDTVRFDDAVWTLFGIEGYGALRVTANRDVVVNSRIYNQEGSSEADTQGQFFCAVPTSFAIGAGEDTDVLGINQASDGSFRYNFGLVETSGNNATVEVTLLDGDGSGIGAGTYNLGPYGVMQVNVSDLAGAGSTPTQNGRLHVYVRPESSGSVIAFGSGIANTSQDPSTFEMTLQQESSSSGDGDITAVYAGSGLSGGGTSGDVTLSVANNGISSSMIQDGTVGTSDLANASVTASKISGSGAASGQVLKFNGSSVTWANDETGGGGLTLPYQGQGSTSDSALFRIQNAGSAVAILGEATSNGTGLSGYSASGYGLYASSSSGYAAWLNGRVMSGELTASSGGFSVKLAQSPYAVDASGSSTQGTIRGVSTATNGIGVYGIANTGGIAAGVYGESSQGYGVAGFAGTSGNKAGWFYNDAYVHGDLDVSGTITKGGGSFKIDHPLDPEHKYLSHSFVESPDMMNVYNGNVETDSDGFATVQLPEWFEALNRDFRYQLTVIGGGETWALARVYREIEDNAFVIQTNVPHTRVSWQVTGIRHDRWAEAHRIPVEEEKPAVEQGYYLHPELFGLTQRESVEYARSPELMERVLSRMESMEEQR